MAFFRADYQFIRMKCTATCGKVSLYSLSARVRGRSSNVRSQRYRISCLQEHGSGTSEFAGETFAGAEIADHAARRDAFKHVTAVPGDQMTVVNNVLFACSNLNSPECQSCILDKERAGATLTSFRMMAPKLVIQRMPVPEILYVNQPSPENIIFPKFWAL